MPTPILIDSRKALQKLGLYDPDKHSRPNISRLRVLSDLGWLKRYQVMKKGFHYDLHQCETLLVEMQTRGFALTNPPAK